MFQASWWPLRFLARFGFQIMNDSQLFHECTKLSLEGRVINKKRWTNFMRGSFFVWNSLQKLKYFFVQIWFLFDEVKFPFVILPSAFVDRNSWNTIFGFF